MSQAANTARLGTYSELGQRYRGTVLAKAWLQQAGAEVGDEVALERDGGRIRVVLPHGDWPENPDWVKELKRYGSSSVAVHLPPLAATVLGLEEAGDDLAQKRDADCSQVLLSGV
jgi:hypothetical protein